MNILITGASGFVGKNLCVYLENAGHQVKTLSLRGSFGENDLEAADVIIHLAGKAHDVENTASPEVYYNVNFDLTKKIYSLFLTSGATKFIFLSSIKAVSDHADVALTETMQPTPQTHYGKSKRMAEEYITHTPLPADKSYFILRPCMIHGPGNKGNLNLLYKLVAKGVPWPLTSFGNRRSFLSVENLCFTIKELLEKNIAYGIYNVADSETISTNQLIDFISEELNLRTRKLKVPKRWVTALAKLGAVLRLPFNTERLRKLTGNYIVSNKKLLAALHTRLPVSAEEGIRVTIRSFKKDKVK